MIVEDRNDLERLFDDIFVTDFPFRSRPAMASPSSCLLSRPEISEDPTGSVHAVMPTVMVVGGWAAKSVIQGLRHLGWAVRHIRTHKRASTVSEGIVAVVLVKDASDRHLTGWFDRLKTDLPKIVVSQTWHDARPVLEKHHLLEAHHMLSPRPAMSAVKPSPDVVAVPTVPKTQTVRELRQWVSLLIDEDPCRILDVSWLAGQASDLAGQIIDDDIVRSVIRDQQATWAENPAARSVLRASVIRKLFETPLRDGYAPPTSVVVKNACRVILAVGAQSDDIARVRDVVFDATGYSKQLRRDGFYDKHDHLTIGVGRTFPAPDPTLVHPARAETSVSVPEKPQKVLVPSKPEPVSEPTSVPVPRAPQASPIPNTPAPISTVSSNVESVQSVDALLVSLAAWGPKADVSMTIKVGRFSIRIMT